MLAVGAILGWFLLLTVGLSIVEFRRLTPLAFRCLRCGAQFRQSPLRDYPRECPACRAREWATGAR